MESEEEYFHLLPELRQLILLSSNPPIFPGGASASGDLYVSPQPPAPPAPSHPPSISASNGGICSSQSRWPRQETLTLLEIRARLDPKFRETGQKASLWDEVARIMADEHGYQRSGRKCKEKLDNLYKYYKKTREGKIGKHDGKHYRFFRQLDALYGPSTAPSSSGDPPIQIPNPTNPKKQSFIENLNALASSDEEEPASMAARKSWIADLVEAQMKRLMATQEAWFEKMMRSFERMEQGRVRREEGWRREEAEREERERRRAAREREWAAAREASLIAAMEKIVRRREKMECQMGRSMGLL